MMINIKSLSEIELMRRAGKISKNALIVAGKLMKPGTTTAEVDHAVEQYILSEGATPSFKGYGGFPASACISVNEEVIHGIPGDRVMQSGDIVSVDVGLATKATMETVRQHLLSETFPKSKRR